LNFGLPFVKMEAVNVTDLQGALNERLGPTPNKTSLHAFIATLKNPGGLERLGQIIAVDLFNGNKDRFFPDTPFTKTIGGVTFNFRCLVNPGNVFRVDLGTGGSEIGALDFVDPNSEYKDSTIPLATAEATAMSGPWPGRVLADASRRTAFADDVVHDLEAIVSPHGYVRKLGLYRSSRITNGMVQGAQLIRNKLKQKYESQGWPQGIKDRYDILLLVQ
jgi:hypothetical protein